MLRHRSTRSIVKLRELDAFPKVSESYQETSSVGGIVSLLSYILIVFLLFTEITYYLESRFVFKFVPDVNMDSKLKINIDLTVAMPCHDIGADILDSTSQNIFQFGVLEQEDTWFELTPNQRKHFDSVRHLNTYLREEFHAIQDLLWKSGQTSMFIEMPERSYKPLTPSDACRIYGRLELNKVSGNFHITAGRSLNLPRGHVHISSLMSETDYNFTHRINRFSFGDPSPGIVHPLEGDEKITKTNVMLYQYFVDVVPTDVDTFFSTMKTYQYSVKDQARPIDHHKGSHGVPGIFFKYDMSPLKVQVSQERDNLLQFIVKLCATAGGIFVTTGIINGLIQGLINIVKNNFGAQSLISLNQESTLHSSNSTTSTSILSNPEKTCPIQFMAVQKSDPH